jgi:hypothetical protein
MRKVIGKKTRYSRLVLSAFIYSGVINSLYAKSNEDMSIDGSVTEAPFGSVVRVDSGFQLVGGSEKDNVTLKFAPKNNPHYSFTLSTPLGSKKTSANLYSSKTNAFADSTTLSFNYRFNQLGEADDFYNKITQNHVLLLSLSQSCLDDPTQFGLETNEQMKCNEMEISKKLAAFKKSTGRSFSSAVAELFDDLTFHTWGFSATYGRQEYKYFSKEIPTITDENGFLKVNTLDESKNPWGVSAYYQFLVSGKYALWAELAYQEGFEAKDDTTKCLVPNDDATIVEGCISSQSSAPARDDNVNLTLGVRSTLPILGLPFSFQTTYDFKDDEHSFELPIYLITDAKRNWTTGVRWDYDSGKSGSTLSLFIGSSFDFPAK